MLDTEHAGGDVGTRMDQGRGAVARGPDPVPRLPSARQVLVADGQHDADVIGVVAAADVIEVTDRARPSEIVEAAEDVVAAVLR